MSSHRISHIALHVESLRQAVTFYARLFDLRTVRGLPPEECGARGPSAPTGRADPCDCEEARDGCVLERDGFRLWLRPGVAEPAADGRLAHIGLRVSLDELAPLVRRARRLGCCIVRKGADQILLEDVYGICWLVAAEAAAEGGGATGPRRSH